MYWTNVLGKLGDQKYTETFVNQLIGPHPHKIILVLLAQAMVMERNICFDGK